MLQFLGSIRRKGYLTHETHNPLLADTGVKRDHSSSPPIEPRQCKSGILLENKEIA